MMSRSPCGANGILNVNNRIALTWETGTPHTAAGELSGKLYFRNGFLLFFVPGGSLDLASMPVFGARLLSS
jgi:hypothetical protein